MISLTAIFAAILAVIAAISAAMYPALIKAAAGFFAWLIFQPLKLLVKKVYNYLAGT